MKKKFSAKDLVYIGLSAAIVAVCSWITIPVGAVPITLQTMAVCLVAGLFGFKNGTLSVLAYILIGAVGVPVFSGFKGGIGVLFGATGGYIIGFIFTSVIVGLTADKTKKPLWLALSMAAGILVCYAFGTAWFMLAYSKGITLSKALAMCVTPFLAFDFVKILLASALTVKLKDKILKSERA